MQALKVAVVVMGILIVAGVAVIGTTLVNRLNSPGAAASTTLDEPAGTHIAGTSLAQDRLALHLQGGGPDRVVVIDTRSGHILFRTTLPR